MSGVPSAMLLRYAGPHSRSKFATRKRAIIAIFGRVQFTSPSGLTKWCRHYHVVLCAMVGTLGARVGALQHRFPVQPLKSRSIVQPQRLSLHSDVVNGPYGQRGSRRPSNLLFSSLLLAYLPHTSCVIDHDGVCYEIFPGIMTMPMLVCILQNPMGSLSHVSDDCLSVMVRGQC